MQKTKKTKKYVTVDEGVDFRTIAKIMTKKGFKMNHATARNVLISAIKRLMNFSAEQVGVKITSENMTRLIKDQDLHGALADVLYRAHKTNIVGKTDEGGG
jgi:hypothetical protein